MFNLEAVSTQRLYRVIAEKIAEKINSGEFEAGGRLPGERELAEILQVSRSSVREALIALELSGYVEVRVGSGVYVAQRPTAANEEAGAGLPLLARMASDMGPFELLEARLLIEPECAAYAAQRGSDAQLETIRQKQEAMSSTAAPSSHDRDFHAAIAAACGNSALEAVVMHLWDLSEASPIYQRLGKHFVDIKVWELALTEHDRVAEAILDRDPIRARHAMHAHLIAIMARLREDFADSLPEAVAPFTPVAPASPVAPVGRQLYAIRPAGLRTGTPPKPVKPASRKAP